jgi:hypothetical protein
MYREQLGAERLLERCLLADHRDGTWSEAPSPRSRAWLVLEFLERRPRHTIWALKRFRSPSLRRTRRTYVTGQARPGALHVIPPIQPGQQLQPRPLDPGTAPADAVRFRLAFHRIQLVLAPRPAPGVPSLAAGGGSAAGASSQRLEREAVQMLKEPGASGVLGELVQRLFRTAALGADLAKARRACWKALDSRAGWCAGARPAQAGVVELAGGLVADEQGPSPARAHPASAPRAQRRGCA